MLHKSKEVLVSWTALQEIGVGGAQGARGDKTRTADPNLSKGDPAPGGIMFSSKYWNKEGGRWDALGGDVGK